MSRRIVTPHYNQTGADSSRLKDYIQEEDCKKSISENQQLCFSHGKTIGNKSNTDKGIGVEPLLQYNKEKLNDSPQEILYQLHITDKLDPVNFSNGTDKLPAKQKYFEYNRRFELKKRHQTLYPYKKVNRSPIKDPKQKTTYRNPKEYAYETPNNNPNLGSITAIYANNYIKTVNQKCIKYIKEDQPIITTDKRQYFIPTGQKVWNCYEPNPNLVACGLSIPNGCNKKSNELLKSQTNEEFIEMIDLKKPQIMKPEFYRDEILTSEDDMKKTCLEQILYEQLIDRKRGNETTLEKSKTMSNIIKDDKTIKTQELHNYIALIHSNKYKVIFMQ